MVIVPVSRHSARVFDRVFDDAFDRFFCNGDTPVLNARTPALDDATLATIRQRLEALGYDPARFVPTAQQAAPH